MEDKSPELIILCTVMLVVSTIVVAIRCLAVWAGPNHKFGWDDYFAIATIVSLTSFEKAHDH